MKKITKTTTAARARRITSVLWTLLNSTEGNLKTKDGEELTYRVYSDGGVKIEGLNMRKDFKNVNDAIKYIKSKKISLGKKRRF